MGKRFDLNTPRRKEILITVNQLMVSFVKLFSFVLTGFLLALLAAPTLAVQLHTPNSFSVFQAKNTLEATIRNNSNAELPLQISLFAPSRYQIQAPPRIPANSEAKIRIVFDNYPYLHDTTYETRLQALLGNEAAARKILVSFQKPSEQAPQPQPQPNPKPGDQNFIKDFQKNVATGFSVIFGAANFELTLQILLGIIVVLLCIALIARLYNRAKGE